MNIWPTDIDFGILGFQFKEGIGGKLKQSPEDFIVTEVDINTMQPLPKPPNAMYEHGDGGGLYLGGRVWKRNVEHAKMIRRIARAFGVSESDVSTAGIKDKRAVTTQLFSVYQPSKVVHDPVQLDDGIELDSFHYYRERMYPGRMGGNSFEIIIRDCEDRDDLLGEFSNFISQGILNHYGYQRMGGTRPISAQFGRELINKRYKNAIDIYLGGRSLVNDEFRKLWRDTGDPEDVLRQWINTPRTEKKMLEHLIRRRGDYQGALRHLPESVYNITTSAFISLLFNHYISIRGLETDVLKGERENNDNIEIALPSKQWIEPLNDVWMEVFEHHNIKIEELAKIKHTSRFLKLFPLDFSAEILGSSCEVTFSLPPGSYATTVLRELMQVPPANLC